MGDWLHKVLGLIGSELWFRWRVDVGPLMVVIGSSLPSSTKKKTNKKTLPKSDPSGKVFWIRAKCTNSSEPSLRSDL